MMMLCLNVRSIAIITVNDVDYCKKPKKVDTKNILMMRKIIRV